MAKRECPFCKEMVKDNAVICMHCKSALTPLPVKEWYQTWKGLVLIVFCTGMVGSFMQSNNRPAAAPAETPEQVAAKNSQMDSIDARVNAKLYVGKKLKAPTTAKWPNTMEFGVAPKKDKKGNKIKDVWDVTGHVDSQNSFGAMLRQKWHATMKKTNNTWRMLDVEFWE